MTAVLDPPPDDRAARRSTAARRQSADAEPVAPRVARPRRRPRLGAARRCSRSCSARPSSTSGGSARRAGRTRTTPPRCRPAPRAGAPSSSVRSTARTSSPSTSRRPSLWVMGISARLFGVNAWSILVPQALEGVAAVGAAVRDRAPLVLAGRGLGRGRGARVESGRGADVPVQQSRRAARAAARRRRVRDDACARVGPHHVAAARVLVRRLRLPGEDVAGAARRARVRSRLPLRRAAAARPAHRPARARRGRAHRVRGLVDRGGAADAGVRAAVRRRIAGQQPVEPDLRVQRLRPAHRQRDRQRGREHAGRRAVGPDRDPAHVQHRVRRSDLVAAARGVDPARRGTALHGARAAHRPQPRRVAAVGRLVARDRRRVQPRSRHHPPVLHRRARAGDRCAGRHRRRTCCGSTAPTSLARLFLAAAVFATSWWSVQLLQRSGDWQSWLRPVVLVGGITVAVALVVWQAEWHRAVAALAIGAAVVGLAGPAAYAIDTAATPHAGAIPSAGPAIARSVPDAFGRRASRSATASPRAGPRRELRRAHRIGVERQPGPGSSVAGTPGGDTRRAPRRERAERGADRVARGERRASTAGSRRRSARTRRPATSSRRTTRSWRSVGSTAPTRRRRSRSSSSTSRTATSTTSSAVGSAAASAVGSDRRARARRARSRRGCRRTSRRRRVGGVTVYDLTASRCNARCTFHAVSDRTREQPSRRGL